MYISKIRIHNYRNFKDTEVNFNDGINVIIGHNNSGKSNLIKALSLFFDSNTKKSLEIDDFNKYIPIESLKKEPPKISIEITINQSDNEDLMSDDLVTVSNWLTELEEPYEAKLTYEFLLPYKEHNKYKKMVNALTNKEEIWRVIKDEFLRLYTFKIWSGNIINQMMADRESLQKFDFQFLDAIRNVERDMFSGRHTLLKDVLDFFMDYEIKSNTDLTEKQRMAEIKDKKQNFHNDANELLDKLQDRMDEGKNQILSYAQDIGASFDKSYPEFDGNISEIELYSALKLIIEYETGLKIPVSHNGLGYNNLIFMSLLLSKMQVDSDGEYLSSNAKVFPILSIEEPEAHLHPSMQFQLLKFLNKNMKKNKVRQIFITTHSTHITASSSLDEIICLYKKDNDTYVGYPGKVFPDDGRKSKKYVQRFLDATKSDMLFANKVILVEGIAEQLLLSIFSQYIGISLEEKHIAVVNVGGRYFNYFLYLFDSKNSFAINRKVACLTDRDPERKKIGSNKFQKCYPFEYNVQEKQYEFQQNTYLDDYKEDKHPNIALFTQEENYGKTFEYELALANPSLELLVTDSIQNADEIKGLMNAYREDKELSELKNLLRSSKENRRIIESLNNANNNNWQDNYKKKALIAARYLNSVGKGENALELAYVLEDNLEKKGTPNYKEFNVPKYISKAIEWLCKE